jgi:hypothetical protein
MKHGSGINDRDDRSSGIEILMTDVFATINPTEVRTRIVYYESRKRELKIRLMNEGRCDEKLKS